MITVEQNKKEGCCKKLPAESIGEGVGSEYIEKETSNMSPIR